MPGVGWGQHTCGPSQSSCLSPALSVGTSFAVWAAHERVRGSFHLPHLECEPGKGLCVEKSSLCFPERTLSYSSSGRPPVRVGDYPQLR